jgi:hypothetical protein
MRYLPPQVHLFLSILFAGSDSFNYVLYPMFWWYFKTTGADLLVFNEAVIPGLLP